MVCNKQQRPPGLKAAGGWTACTLQTWVFCQFWVKYDWDFFSENIGRRWGKLNKPIEDDIRGPADSQVMALIIPQLSFGAISETPRLKIQITIIQSLSVPWDTQEELMDEMSGFGNA